MFNGFCRNGEHLRVSRLWKLRLVRNCFRCIRRKADPLFWNCDSLWFELRGQIFIGDGVREDWLYKVIFLRLRNVNFEKCGLFNLDRYRWQFRIVLRRWFCNVSFARFYSALPLRRRLGFHNNGCLFTTSRCRSTIHLNAILAHVVRSLYILVAFRGALRVLL